MYVLFTYPYLIADFHREVGGTCLLTEAFPCFFLNCKANAKVKPAKTGHRPHSS